MTGQTTQSFGELENLTESVGRLADRLQIVGDSLDAIAEDFNWLTRNPLRFEFETVLTGRCRGFGLNDGADCGFPEQPNTPPDAGAAVARVAECLQRTLAALTAEQIDALIATFDEAQGHLLPLMRGEVREALHPRQMMAAAVCPAVPLSGQSNSTGNLIPVPEKREGKSVPAASAKHAGPPGRLF